MVAHESGASDDKARCAEAALLCVMINESFLHRVHLFGCADSFHGRDFAALGFDGQHRAGINRVAIHQHCAGAAGAAVADFLATGEVETVAKRVEQRDARFEVQAAALPVDLEAERDLARTYYSPFAGEAFLETDRRQQAGRDGADAESFEETAPRKAGGFGRLSFVRHHGRLSIYLYLAPQIPPREARGLHGCTPGP